jgi:hypothetical protein
MYILKLINNIVNLWKFGKIEKYLSTILSLKTEKCTKLKKKKKAKNVIKNLIWTIYLDYLD